MNLVSDAGHFLPYKASFIYLGQRTAQLANLVARGSSVL